MYSDITDYQIAKFHKLQLLLSNTPSHADSDEYISVEFQQPLIKWPSEHKVLAHGKYYKIKNTCSICSTSQKINKNSPHLAIESKLLANFIEGDWISIKCEIWSMGFYVTRSFSFYNMLLLSWREEQKFYLDPFCAVPKFSLVTSGDYDLTQKNIAKQEIEKHVDLYLVDAWLTIFDRKMSEEMSKSNACNKGTWEVDISYSLKDNFDCPELNFTIPTTQYGIAKLDTNDEGSALLYLGFIHSKRPLNNKEHRPTSYQDPLIKCTWAKKKIFRPAKEQWLTINHTFLHSNSMDSYGCRSHSFIIQIFIIHVLYQI